MEFKVSFFCVGEKAGFLLGLPLQVLPLLHLTALGVSVSELTPVCHSYWEVQFDTGSWNSERSL